MQLDQRIERYKALEQYRGRPLIVYATSTRPGVPGMMAADVIREFVDQIDAIPATQRSVDVLVNSFGGDGLTAWRIMSLLRGRFDRIGVLVPFNAFSAATLLALGADEIILHPHASLGPIDPQIQSIEQGQPVQFAYEDVGAFLRFLSEDAGLTEQAYIAPVLDKLFSVVKPVLIGGAKRASQLSSDVGERLLAMHMNGAEDRAKAKVIADNLNKSFFSHGDAISRGRARALDLPVAADNVELERLLWNAYLGIEEYMQLRRPFNQLQYFLANPDGRASIYPNHPAPLPGLAPGAQQPLAIQSPQRGPVEVPCTVVNALVESCRAASECRTLGVISAFRNGPMVQCVQTDLESGWRIVRGSEPVRVPSPRHRQASAAAETVDAAPERAIELTPARARRSRAKMQGVQRATEQQS